MTMRNVVSLTCLLALAVPYLPKPVQAADQVGEMTRAAYEDCAARDEDALGTALAAISAEALNRGIGELDYRGLVGEAWRRNNVDDVIDKRVDIAVEEVKAETSWTQRLSSLTNTEASQKLATAVAERVYHSDAVKDALEAVARDVAKDVGRAMEGATSDAAGPVLDCLKAFIGPRYGSAVAQAVAGDASQDIGVDPNKGTGEPTAGAVLKESGEGIAGATILIVRRQLANIATRVGQRIVGSVLSRLVSVAAGGIGLVLIAKDIWDFRNGVLPIIAAEMKSTATKDKVRDEVASTIAQQIGEHVKEIATASAMHIVEVWKEFKRAHAMVLRLAQSDGAFRSFVDSVKPSSMARLTEIVGLIVADEGETAVSARLANGTLNNAVHVMPEQAVQIARETGSLTKALGWSAVAGDRIDAVLEYDIHKRAEPKDFTQQALARILSLQDRNAIMRMASLPLEAREVLFGVGSEDLGVLARNLSENELTTLASYLDGLQAGPRERVLRAVATSPGKMQLLATERVRDGIITSVIQADAVSMMLETPPGFSPRLFVHDLKLAAEGRVNPILLWAKHPAGVVLLGVLFLIVVLWLGRLFRRPRSAPPTPPSPTAA